MARRVGVGQLGDAVQQELVGYSENVTKELKKAVLTTTTKMVKETKAQKFDRSRGAKGYSNSIASRKLSETPQELVRQWYVKAPNYRLSHLLNDGHATVNGGRTKAYKHIDKAEENAEKELMAKAMEAIKNG